MVTEDETRPARVMRLCLQFDGTNFEGWQRQAQGRTVQGVVESALAQILGAHHGVHGSSRTDAGTHARGMVASFRTDHAMPAGTLARALDAVLPDDVGVRWVHDAPPDFHARKDALWKWYRYRILVAAHSHPLVSGQSWRRTRVASRADLQALATTLVGQHDFASFANAGSPVVDTVRTLYDLRWTRLPLDRGDGVALPEAEGSFLVLDALGDGFLYKMVRTLVGTMLMAVGEPEPVRRIQQILSARDRRAAGPAAPACGLTLMAVAHRGLPAPEIPAGLLLPGGASEDPRTVPSFADERTAGNPTQGRRT